MAEKQPDVIELSRQDWGRLVIHQIARLGLAPEEYFTKEAAGEIDCTDSPAVMDVRMVMQLGGQGDTTKERFDSARRDLMDLVQNQQI